jgi:hypothetical protein
MSFQFSPANHEIIVYIYNFSGAAKHVDSSQNGTYAILSAVSDMVKQVASGAMMSMINYKVRSL